MLQILNISKLIELLVGLRRQAPSSLAFPASVFKAVLEILFWTCLTKGYYNVCIKQLTLEKFL